jgi:transposase
MTLERSEEQSSMLIPSAHSGEEGMVRQEKWEQIRRLHRVERRSISEIAKALDLDRKTVRRCVRQERWQPYRRAAKQDTLLAEHADFVRERAAQVCYSARILYQELTRQRGFRGSYDVVKRFVAPLRELEKQAEATRIRFETPPGLQSQVDFGESQVRFRSGPIQMHIFVLTLGFSRRGFYWGTPNERISSFLEAHERAFEHFGGHTREHLYDRPRIVCRPGGEAGKVLWNSTFRSFADYWGFEPRLCQPYRAQTKGKVESGVKYVKRNFLPGREFIDIVDFQEQLCEWNATIADVRQHGTTHEQPLERFERERAALIPTRGQGSFLTDMCLNRIVASDYLVTVDTKRYSVPFRLIGEAVEVERSAGEIRLYHGGELVARHPQLPERHHLSILPEHGPGALRRSRKHSSIAARTGSAGVEEVEIRDLQVYEELVAGEAVQP